MLAIYQTLLAAAGAHAGMLRRCLALGVAAAFIQGAAFVLFIPFFRAIAANHTGAAVVWLMVLSAMLVLASICRWYAQDYDYNGDCARAGDTMRHRLGEHLRRIPLQSLYRKRSGETVALIAGTVDEVFNYTLMVCLMLINAIVIPLTTALGAVFFDWRLGMILLLSFFLIIPIQRWSKPLLARNKAAIAAANARLNAELLEYSQGLPVLKAAGRTERASLNSAIHAVEGEQQTAMRSEALPNVLLSSAVEIIMLLVLIAGLVFISHGDLSVWLLCALMVACVRFAEPMGTLLSMMGVFEMMREGYQRLQSLLDEKPLPQLPAATPSGHDITLEQIDFAYEGEAVLHDISLHIPEHAMTAIVGPSGCGKTTLIRLIMRYADPQSGSIRLGGADIRAIADLMQYISVVFQDVYLFDDTVENNIRLGKSDAGHAEIEAAARAAGCHDFIMALPAGYQTRIGDIGGHLSGGEKQRISIARALLKNSPIIILDEPTASLDVISEVAVQQAIDALIADKTVIVITHRLSTIAGADQIVVMKEGRICESGTHDSLLGQEGLYAHLWQRQNSPLLAD